ncbi:SCO family protein [Leptospira adleri]|uniref:SCO family protein n=1 Tax=Leptospira adleri TaxID=2023186 RepID=A0A2M9YLN9_9LEPT|nr:SCO family protein [Leptospira adleri]PJZ52444.1 hypothetical protein CH380_14855 [Leptospira adleri]PJZ63617.1 hypothetical protein CH376_01875 [Leptospira adleri]
MNFHSFVSKSISASIIAGCLYFVLAANPFVIADLQNAGIGFKTDRDIPKFRIQNDKDIYIADSDLKGGKYLIYFGYGDCRSVCRTGISKLETFLSKEEFSSWNLVLISLDPEKDRDKKSWLRKYLSHWKKQPILLLPESREDSKKIADRFQVVVNDGFGSDIAHQNSVLMTDTKGKIAFVISDLNGFSETAFQKLNARVY